MIRGNPEVIQDDGLINHSEMKVKGKVDKAIQKGQCMGCISTLLNASNYFSNKDKFNSNFVICSLDIDISLRHLAGPMFRESINYFLAGQTYFPK